MKIVVTHTSPDLDALTAVWLLRRFHPKFTDSEMRFVAAGEKYELTEIERIKNPEVIHVDTGGGEFDHHQTGDKGVCAASLVLEYLIKNQFIKTSHENALERMAKIVLEIDHFGEVFWPDAAADRYEFFLENILEGFKMRYRDQNERVVNFGLEILDAVFQKMAQKVKADEEIENGTISEVEGLHGKSQQMIAMETINDEVVKLAQKKGFPVVIRRDPRKGYVRIKAIPGGKFDLSDAYSALRKKDPDATWFLHASHRMILNGSTKNPKMKPTKLALDEVVEIVRENL